MKRESLAPLAATAASLFFGASVVATRYVVGQVDPVSLAFLRYLIATLCLAVLAWRGLHSVSRKDLLFVAMLGVLFFGLFPASFSAALKYIPSARGALILATQPFITLLLSRWRGYEQLTAPKLGGMALAFVGLAVVLGGSAGTSSAESWVGDGLMFVATVCASIYNVFSRPLLKRNAPMIVTSLSMLAGTIALAPLALAGGLLSTLPAVTSTGWMSIAFLGTFGGALGFYLWIWALRNTTPSRVAVFITLNPVAAVVFGNILLGEAVTPALLVGLACVGGGIFVANLRYEPKKAPVPSLEGKSG